MPAEFPLLGPLLGRNWLLQFVGEQYSESPLNFGVMVLSVALAVAGWGVAWLLYGRNPLGTEQPDPLAAALGPLHTLLKNKYYVDELYAAVIVRPILMLAGWVYDLVDRAAIDGFLHAVGPTVARWGKLNRQFDLYVINGAGDMTGKGTKQIGQISRHIQTGRIQDYMLIALTATLLLGITWYLLIR